MWGEKFGPQQKVFLQIYKTSLLISVPEVVGYKISLFKIFIPKWLLIRPYGDLVQGLITSLPCTN